MDIILYNISVALVTFLIGYFFGSIPFGIILGKCIYHRDPRDEGSHNSGGTNVGRVFGKKAGLACIILDMLKVVVPMVSIWAIIRFSGFSEWFANSVGKPMFDNGLFYIYLTGMGALLGHCYPVYVGFKGGKAVSTYCGVGLATSWLLSLIGIATFFTTLKKTKYVSLSSMLMAVISATFSWILFAVKFIPGNPIPELFMWGNGNYLTCGWEYSTLLTFGAILVVTRHIPNIKRLKAGTESKIKWMK